MGRTGKFFVIAAPSGAGKTSLVKALVEQVNGIKISISYTTRPKRQDEVDEVDYHFISEQTYQQMLEKDAFLEHATVFGYHYGTAKEWVGRQLQKGVDVVLEIDWQGARQIRELFPRAVSIFILPPSLNTLLERLKKRGQDDLGIIEKRMSQAHHELQHYQEFDYLIVNQDFEAALADLKHIVQAERLRCLDQQDMLGQLLAQLLKA